MSRSRLASPLLVLAVVLASAGLGRFAAASGQDQAPDPEILESGRKLYVENCQPCHGDSGAGDGPAARFLETRPRDLTAGNWMFIDDGSYESIREVVAVGIDGTDMEPFDEILTAEEIEAIAHFVVAEIVSVETESR